MFHTASANFIYKRMILLNILLLSVSACGVKGRPLPPLKEPFISTGSYEKDKEEKARKKNKQNSLQIQNEINKNENN